MILGKPADPDDAVKMLSMLRNRSHQVISAICLLRTDDGQTIVGRRVSPSWAAQAVSIDAPQISQSQALALLREGHTVLDLTDGLQLRRSRLMHHLDPPCFQVPSWVD